jgi:DNA-binding NtrC family response regulator
MQATDRLVSARRGVELQLDGFSLRVTTGPDAGKTVQAQEGEVGIGTAPGNELVLTDPTVSRHHCSIAATPEGLLLTDLGSANGTSIHGVRVLSAYVGFGAQLTLGRTTLEVALAADIRLPLSPEDRFGKLLGSSAPMRRIFALLPRIAQSDTTVLLEGETGTGKGVIAEAIHGASARAAGPFVVLDCSAIAPGLVESELFGHTKGSFTGAVADRAGAFEHAAGGTIFIDELGELPAEMQPKLLRALEERTVKRVGGNERVPLDVRVVAATNRDLRKEVNDGTFRADLFYRFNVVRLRVPPLRERVDDIELLARHFHRELRADEDIAPELLASYRRQRWPGNVRELRAAVERHVLLGYSADVEPAAHEAEAEEALAAFVARTTGADRHLSFRAAKQLAVDAWEHAFLEQLMRAAGGNLSKAAALAEMDRSHLRDLLKRYGLHEPKR